MTTPNRNASRGTRHSSFNIVHFLALLLAACLIFSHSMSESVDHDEHQFVAGSALLARRGLLPYRDYPYLHTPYGVFADAAAFRLAGPSAKLLLTARLVSAACGFAMVALLASAVSSAYHNQPPWTRLWVPSAAVLLLLTNPLFAAVTGMAWNHDAAELPLFAAAMLFLRDIRRGSSSARSMLAAGALLGLSIGLRLTVAPAAAAFAGWALADTRRPWRRRLSLTGLFLLGAALALSPCGWLFLQSPRGFLFGNSEYPTLNTAYRIAHGSLTSSTTPMGKVSYFFSRIVFSSGSGFLVMLIGLTIWMRRSKRSDCAWSRLHSSSTPGRSGPGLGTSQAPKTSQPRGREEMTFLGLLILFLLPGSFAPAPLFIVYFYAPVPFVVLWLAYAWRPLLTPRDLLPPPVLRGRAGEGVGTAIAPPENPHPNSPSEYRERGKDEHVTVEYSNPPRQDRRTRFALHQGAAAVLMLCCLACGVPAYRHLATIFRPNQWVPLQVHNSGVDLRRQLEAAGAPRGPVLTLAPIIPLEGGLDIYEEFATGPFAFRAAPMVPATERQAFHLADSFDLSQLLKHRPPMAVLFNVEEREEESPMIGALPKECMKVRLVHGASVSLDRRAARE